MADATPETSWKELAVGQEEMSVRHRAERQAWFDKLEVVTQSLQTGGTTGDTSLDFAILHAGIVLGDLNKTYGGITIALYHIKELLHKATEKIGEYCLFDLWDSDNRQGSVFCAIVPTSGLTLDAAQATLTLGCAKHVRLDDHAMVVEVIDGPLVLPSKYVLDRVLRYKVFNPTYLPRPTRDCAGCFIGDLFGDVEVEECIFKRAWFYNNSDVYHDTELSASVVLAKRLGRQPEAIKPIEFRVSRAKECCLQALTELADKRSVLVAKGRDFAFDVKTVDRIIKEYTVLAVELGLKKADPSQDATEQSTAPTP